VGINLPVDRIYADDIAAGVFQTVAIGRAASQANGQRNPPQTGGFNNFLYGLQETSLCLRHSAIVKPFYAEHVQPPRFSEQHTGSDRRARGFDPDGRHHTTHGEQETSVWNGHYECTCYHPLFVFNQFGDLERCALSRQRA
jgi:hypothetical protein